MALGTAIVYLAGTWAMVGRSYGCHVMGLRVVDRRGRSPRLAMALLRAVLYVFVPLALVALGALFAAGSIPNRQPGSGG